MITTYNSISKNAKVTNSSCGMLFLSDAFGSMMRWDSIEIAASWITSWFEINFASERAAQIGVPKTTGETPLRFIHFNIGWFILEVVDEGTGAGDQST